MNNHLMGLMVLSVESETEENKVYAYSPLELHLDQRIEFEAELFLSEGNSLQAIVDWVKRHKLPEIEPRCSYQGTLDRIATAYNTNFWYEGKGLVMNSIPIRSGPYVPGFADRYIMENPDNLLQRN